MFLRISSFGEVAQGAQAGEKEIRAATNSDELRQTGNAAGRTICLGHGEISGLGAAGYRLAIAEEWIAFGGEHNTPIAPVNTPKTIAADPQFRHRLPWIPKERLEADMLPFPAQITDAEIPVPERAPDVGQHTDEVLRGAGYDHARIEALRKDGIVF